MRKKKNVRTEKMSENKSFRKEKEKNVSKKHSLKKVFQHM